MKHRVETHCDHTRHTIVTHTQSGADKPVVISLFSANIYISVNLLIQCNNYHDNSNKKGSIIQHLGERYFHGMNTQACDRPVVISASETGFDKKKTAAAPQVEILMRVNQYGMKNSRIQIEDGSNCAQQAEKNVLASLREILICFMVKMKPLPL